MRLFSLLSLLFCFSPSYAELIFAGPPTGISAEPINFNANDPDNNFEIAGGITDATCTPSSGVCDSCLVDSVNNWIRDQTSCNMRQISPSTELTMTFSSTAVFGGSVRFSTRAGAASDVQVSLVVPVVPTTAVNQQVTVRVLWSDVCGAFTLSGGALDCGGALGFVDSQLFKVGIDGDNDGELDSTTEDDYVSFTIHINNTRGTLFASKYTPPANLTCANGGFCNFTLSKGDEKAYINDLQIQPSGLSTSYKHVMFFCAEGTDPNQIVSACTNKIAITGTNALANDTIEGMRNDVDFIFRAATVDIAGNIGLFLEADQVVRPEAVVGLFDENSCFIATAAYGTPMKKHVKTLRAFRDNVLRKSTWGQMFVQTYYTLSPPLAKWIAQSSERRTVARFVLTPIVMLTTFIMEHTVVFFMILFLAISGLLFWRWPRKEPLT